ncbi:MAG: SEL1-like repeat protein, partial [Alphaproteobacteria bacterium]|nr:SEL1-like repeat protein [Alphaproteobacteria bacterium]
GAGRDGDGSERLRLQMTNFAPLASGGNVYQYPEARRFLWDDLSKVARAPLNVLLCACLRRSQAVVLAGMAIRWAEIDMRAALGLCIVFLSFIVTPAMSETRVALIVANADYAQAALRNPTVDAGLVEGALDALGFTVVVVANASLGAFDDAISDFALRAKGADLALFYFAGHGFAVTDRGVPRNYLMSTDADVTSSSERVLRSGGIPLDDVIAAISDQAKTTLVFIDACRNDPRISRAAGGRGRSAVAIDRTVGESVFVGLSTRLGDVALDGAPGKGSPFATAFATRIGAPGKRLDDVFTDIRLAVEAETKRFQRPDVGRYDLTVPVVLKPEVVAPTVTTIQVDPCRDAATHWSAIAARTEPILFEEHLRLFPSCAFATLARLSLDGARHSASAAARPQFPASPTDSVHEFPAAPTASVPQSTMRPVPDAPETECDRLAALRFDPERLPSVEGVDEIEIDLEKALPECQQAVAAYPNSFRLAFQLGFVLERKRDHSEATKWYEKAIALGSTTAMVGISHAYRTGNGFEKDEKKALEWLQKSADSGNGIAMFGLGHMYQEGEDVPQDYGKAREWFAAALEAGLDVAIVGIAQMHDKGQGVPRDADEAARLTLDALRMGTPLLLEMVKRELPRFSDDFRKAFQTRLRSAGVFDGAIDGVAGSDTLAAIDAVADVKQ